MIADLTAYKYDDANNPPYSTFFCYEAGYQTYTMIYGKSRMAPYCNHCSWPPQIFLEQQARMPELSAGIARPQVNIKLAI